MITTVPISKTVFKPVRLMNSRYNAYFRSSYGLIINSRYISNRDKTILNMFVGKDVNFIPESDSTLLCSIQPGRGAFRILLNEYGNYVLPPKISGFLFREAREFKHITIELQPFYHKRGEVPTQILKLLINK